MPYYPTLNTYGMIFGKQSKIGNGFEAYFAFLNFFRNAQEINVLFKFRSDFDKIIDWKCEEFQLVTVIRTAPASRLHCHDISLQAERGEDVLSWISTNQTS